MTRVSTWLGGCIATLRHLGERGSTRHVLLLLLVGAALVGLFKWQGEVGCLFTNVAQQLPESGGLQRLYC